ncbi:hypothetical protein GGR58DRAFT_471699 [Xylaria digitata]|nr:hypothetical protein GGR58DRAFT_471699 [Xylaria digitata]
MEAVGAAASIAGLLSLIIQLAQISVDFASKVSGASKAQAEYISELKALQSVLEKFKGAGTVSTTAIDSYKLQVEKVKAKLEKKLARNNPLSGLKSLSWPFEESEMARVVEMLHRLQSILHSSLSADGFYISAETLWEVRNMRSEQQLASLLSWITPSSPQISVDSVLESFCEGTCQSFLQDQRYLDWRDGVEPLLWVSGQPGSGKTILSANVIQNLTEISAPGTIVSYHFFRSDNENDSINSVCRGLLYKALPQISPLPTVAIEHHRRFGRSVRTPTEKLWEVLLGAKSPLNSIYIVFDGIDEFPFLNKLLPQISRLKKAGIKVMVASRNLPTIQAELCRSSHEKASVIEFGAIEEDLRIYADARLRNDSVIDYDEIPDNLRDDLLRDILEAAKGSFLLPRLAMDLICNQTSVASLRSCLSILPTTYEKAYEITFNRILKQPDTIVDLSKRVLNWVLHAKRPLTMQELQHAIAIKSGCKSIDPESLEPPKVILSSCLGMISLSRVDNRVSVVHSTARQFLESNEQELSKRPQFDIAQNCLTYLTFDELSSGPCESVGDLQNRLIRLPFLNYCARAWGHHVRQFQKALWAEIAGVLCAAPLCEASWQVLRYRQSLDQAVSAEIFKLQPMKPHALHVAAFWGFAGFITRSSWGNHNPHYCDFSPVDSHGWTPLHWAASMGNEESVAALVELGVDIDKADSNGWTPLTFAVVKGHSHIVQLLLQCGAQCGKIDLMGFSIEQWASICSQEEIIKLLQEPKGISPTNAREGTGTRRKREQKLEISVLRSSMDALALEHGLRECSRQLEEMGTVGERPDFIGVEIRPQLWGTMIKLDSYYWESDQRNVGLSTSLRKQILELAILQENLAVIKLIVESNARVSKEIPRGAVGKYQRTCLHTAAYCTDPDIVTYLLSLGADITAKDGMDRTPLHLAAAYGSPAIVKVMAERPDVDINAKDVLGRTPLHWCLALGGWKRRQNRAKENIEISHLLISNGASVGAVDGNGNTTLHYATVLKNKQVIILVLEHGLQLSQKNNNGETPLDSLLDKSYYHRLGGQYGAIWDRPYCVRKYEWHPSEEETMSALRTVQPYISPQIKISSKLKNLLVKLGGPVGISQGIRNDEAAAY